MASSSNYFWLTSLRGDTNVTVADTITGVTTATAGQTLKTIAITGDKAILGATIEITTALGTVITIACKVGSVVGPDPISLSPRNTLTDNLFANAVRVTNSSFDIVSLGAFTGAVGLVITVYQADWSWWDAS
jgi:hypothetical protein